jgi:zinc finger RNA-binding protein
MFYCRVCQIGCVGAQTYKEHLEGQRHKKREATVKTPSASSSQPLTAAAAVAVTSSGAASRAGVVQLHCHLCDVACTGADTYAAHIRGTKHQKVLKLHSALGKSSADKSVSSVGTDDKKDVDLAMDDLDGLLGAESDVQPVGQEYIDEARNESGVAVGFYCKLCDCKFTDPNAKLMHMKGRRHRLQYKKKVDPNLPVDIRPPYGRRGKDEHDKREQEEHARRRYVEDKWSMECEQLRYEDVPLGWLPFPPPGSHPPFPLPPHQLHPHPPFPPLPPGFMPGRPPPGFGPPLPPMRRPDYYNDRHVMAKHTAIYPDEQELESVQLGISTIEKALKLVSDSFVDSDAAPKDSDLPSANEADGKSTSDVSAAAVGSDNRVLRTVLRVGPLAKGLILHEDLHVQLVVLCSEKPTRTLLDTVVDRLTKQLEEHSVAGEYDVRLCVEEAGLIVTRLTAPPTTCTIVLTSPIIRDPLLVPSPERLLSSSAVAAAVNKTDPPDVLDRQKCLEALAEQRRTKWFQARVGGVQSCLVILRIMRDMRRRDSTWRLLSDWMLELLVEKCLISGEGPLTLSPGDALRRVIECIASGILLAGSPGLCDPCEKEPTDAIDCLTNQQKEDITTCAQRALRLIAFRQIHHLLGVDVLPLSSCLPAADISQSRKRQLSESNSATDDVSKKEKH